MNAAQIINWFSEIDISIQLKDNNLLIDHKSPLTHDQIDYLKQRKPELVKHLKSVLVKTEDVYGRRQCLTCEYWELERCNHYYYKSHDAWGVELHYTPDPEQWTRCKHHSNVVNQKKL